MLRAGFVLLMVGLVATACGGGGDADDVSEFTSLVVGDCFDSLVPESPNLLDATEFQETPCSDPHDGEVTAVSTRIEDAGDVLFCGRKLGEYFGDTPAGLIAWGYQESRFVAGSDPSTAVICAAVSRDTLTEWGILSGDGPGDPSTAVPTSVDTPVATAVSTATSTAVPTATATPSPIPIPAPPLVAPGWEDAEVRTLCLIVTEAYPQVDGDPADHFADLARSVLKELRLALVTPDGACDASLTLDVTGTALGSDYQNLGYLYTGATFEGTFTLSASGRTDITGALDGTKSPPFSVFFFRPPEEPEDAPFEVVAAQALPASLAEIWGVEAYLAAIRAFREPELLAASVRTVSGAYPGGVLDADDAARLLDDLRPSLARAAKDGDLGRAAAALYGGWAMSGDLSDEAETVAVDGLILLLYDYQDTGALFLIIEELGGLGAAGKIDDEQQGPVIVRLIELLKHDFRDLAVEAADALRLITGNAFGVDADRWQAWWEGES